MPQNMSIGGWGYPPIREALADTVMETIGVCVSRIQNTVAQYTSTQPIFDITVT